MLKMYNPFHKITINDIRERDLQQAELDLHDAELTLERAQANVAMLKSRIERLQNATQ